MLQATMLAKAPSGSVSGSTLVLIPGFLNIGLKRITPLKKNQKNATKSVNNSNIN